MAMERLTVRQQALWHISHAIDLCELANETVPACHLQLGADLLLESIRENSEAEEPRFGFYLVN
jgi:hypothetical protein